MQLRFPVVAETFRLPLAVDRLQLNLPGDFFLSVDVEEGVEMQPEPGRPFLLSYLDVREVAHLPRDSFEPAGFS
eukprot:1261461-Heterocapsa_arctica.AAC.1